MKLPRIGRFVPQCKPDGSFENKQCHASTGQCWCVDNNGNEWFGTRTRGELNCNETGKCMNKLVNCCTKIDYQPQDQ